MERATRLGVEDDHVDVDDVVGPAPVVALRQDAMVAVPESYCEASIISKETKTRS